MGLGKNKGRMCVNGRDAFVLGGSYTVHSLISIYRSVSVCLSVDQTKYRGTYRYPLHGETRLGHALDPLFPNTSLRIEHIPPLLSPGARKKYRMAAYALPCGGMGYAMPSARKKTSMNLYACTCVYAPPGGWSGAGCSTFCCEPFARSEGPAESVSVNRA